MGTQKAIAAEIIDGKADYVLGLKGNQETLHQAVIDHINEKLDGDIGPTWSWISVITSHTYRAARFMAHPYRAGHHDRWRIAVAVAVASVLVAGILRYWRRAVTGGQASPTSVANPGTAI